jgi:protein-glutamine gamma-glutamyltransferase
MIRINGRIIPPNNIIENYPANIIERKIINILSESSKMYRYSSLDELRFELKIRSNIVNASIRLNRSGLAFKVFRKAYCNTNFWELTREGGFLLKRNAAPSKAINDIFVNGRKYGTECATAMVIVFYKAVLDIFPEELFNKLFSSIHLMNWSYLDKNLDIGYYVNEEDYLPGDCRYFKNPDVNPLTPELQGENAIDLGNGRYYGHGMGILTGEQIIRELNENRKEGSRRSAYLINSATHPNFKHLAYIYYSYV